MKFAEFLPTAVILVLRRLSLSCDLRIKYTETYNKYIYTYILINELIEADTESEGRVYLSDIVRPGISLIVKREESSGRKLQHELDYVEEDIVEIGVWEYEEHGNTFSYTADESWDYYGTYFEDLDESVLDTIFQIMI